MAYEQNRNYTRQVTFYGRLELTTILHIRIFFDGEQPDGQDYGTPEAQKAKREKYANKIAHYRRDSNAVIQQQKCSDNSRRNNSD